MTRPRVVLLTEIPAPYRIPLFNALAERVDLRVLFLAAQNPDRPYRLHEEEILFDWDVLPGRDLTVRGRWIVLNHGVARRLRGADVVLARRLEPARVLDRARVGAGRAQARRRMGREHAP